MKTCAYCGLSSNLTKEHVLPAWIETKVPEMREKYRSSSRTFFEGPAVVADVCASCNNGRLSDLDDYGSKLWDEFFVRNVMAGETIEFRYQFASLSAWLLKISYNVARAENNEADASMLKRYLTVIGGDQNKPLPPFAIYLELMTPHFFSSEELAALDPEIQSLLFRDDAGRLYQPLLEIRPARSNLVDADVGMRLLGWNSFYFYLLLTRRDITDAEWKRKRRAMRERLPDAKFLDPAGSGLRIRASRSDHLESKAATVFENVTGFRERVNIAKAKLMKTSPNPRTKPRSP